MDKPDGTISAEQIDEQQILLAMLGLKQASPDKFLNAKGRSNSLTMLIFYMLRRKQQNRRNCSKWYFRTAKQMV